MPDYLGKPEIERLALELLGREISDFAVDFIHSINVTEESVRAAYSKLVELSLSEEKIATNAALLGRDPETIQRNYDHHIGLLGGREHGRGILTTFASLLGRHPGTGDGGSKKFRASGGFAGTFQHLAYIDGQSDNANVPLYEKQPMLLNTTPQNKREKIAFLLREVYDYRELGHDEKKAAIKKVFGLVSDNQHLLVESVSTLSTKVERLRQKTA